MSDMIDFKRDYANGKFKSYNYRFHTCQAHMEVTVWSSYTARFYSYATTMAGIAANGNVYLRKDFDCYSRTTTRQVTRFLSDLCGVPISVNELRKWRKDGGNHYNIVLVPIDFIYDNF